MAFTLCVCHIIYFSLFIHLWHICKEQVCTKSIFLSCENGSPVFSVRMFLREFCSNSSFACGLFYLNRADLYLNTKHITFFKWNLLVLNFAHHWPIVANNSQSSDYCLCHNNNNNYCDTCCDTCWTSAVQLLYSWSPTSDLCPDKVIMKDCHFEDD